MRPSVILMATLVWFHLAVFSHAEVDSRGNVVPIPNTNGGSLGGSLSVGDGTINGNTFFGTVTIDGGTSLSSADGTVGKRVGSHGTVFVQGPDSRWLNSDDVFIGDDGYGELFISDEGWVENNDDFSVGFANDGRGWVDLNGSGTILSVGDVLAIGVSGTGNLTADKRARVVSRSGTIGSEANSAGFATITGDASWRMGSDLTVGRFGSGSLQITGGGLVDSLTARVGTTAAGQGIVTVTDRGSIWVNRNDLIVGDQGPGRVSVVDSGYVQVVDAVTVGLRGRIHLRNGRLSANSISNAGVIEGGGHIDGPVTNSTTGSIRANSEQALLFTSTMANLGNLDVIDGEIEFDRSVTNATSGTIAGRDGVIRFRSGLTNNGKLGFSTGETDVFGAISNSATGTVQVGGDGTATFYNDFVNTGTLSVEPKASAVFLGNVATAANARVALAGLAVDQLEDGVPTLNDPLTIAGQLSIDGVLELTSSLDPLDVTEPAARGESITLNLITADELTGTFGQVTYDFRVLNADFVDANGSFRSLDDDSDELGMFRSITYSATSVDLTNYLAIEGDTDGDRNVDFSDFLTVSANFDQPGNWLVGNFDGDEVVGFSDFLTLAQNFGRTASASARSVPEPSTMPLMVLGSLGVLVGRQRRRSRGESEYRISSKE